MYKIMDGNEACAYSSYNFTEVAGIYPITPASTMAELTDKWSSNGKLNYFKSPVKIVEMQSEAGAIGMVHGALQAGCLASTYTASQGLLLMIPNMYKIAGELLPCVINVAARSLATHALSILGDHQDIYATRMTGFAILVSSSVQQVMDLTNVAYLSTIEGRVPFVNSFDGFRTSHELAKVELIDTEEVKYMINYDKLYAFRNQALSPSNPVTRGTNQNDDIYFQMTEARNKYYTNLDEIVCKYMKKISKLTNREYLPFNYYGAKDATRVIVAMGSVCETIRETIDFLNEQDEKVGLVEVHLYRPFSSKYFLDVLPKTVQSIAVLDRTKEAGSQGEPLYLDVSSVIKQASMDEVKVIGGRYGLSSKNTTPRDIKAVYDFLLDENNFTGFTVGICDDVTNLSLEVEEDFHLASCDAEFLVYGFGSDGMVSASKDIMKITGEHTNAFVQGYFQYDSKKSGGVTKCHLRFSNKEIHSSYYVENPSVVVCTRDDYLLKYDVLKGIKEKGCFILVSSKSKEEILDYLPNKVKNTLCEKNIKFYTIDAYSLARKAGLNNKISSILETVIFKVGKMIKYDFAINKMKESLEKKFAYSSNNLVEKNNQVIDEALDYLKEIDLENKEYKEEKGQEKTVFEIIDSKEGDTLPVSAFVNKPDGTTAPGLSREEKRKISEVAPCFLSENCIQCNLCSFVCPHGVIRPYLLDEKEVENAPSKVKDTLLPALGSDSKFTIGVASDHCTGCSLCEQICPGKKGKKAIEMKKIEELSTAQNEFNYLEETKEKGVDLNTVKGSQFSRPKFEFPGACAGCGETAYLKLLTQLFKDRLVIANATGCSSIYGASSPVTPYSIPWANSLFEDNAEFGMGMRVADDTLKERIKNIIEENLDLTGSDYDIYSKYLQDTNYENAKALYDIVDDSKIEELKSLKPFILPRSYFLVGGDGWAYDIGYSGIDHVLSTNENVNILVLDTELYSNTGGQVSKSSRRGSVSKFASKGKKNAKKDLAKMALAYPNAYVASINLGANPMHTLKILKEAESYNGVSIIIAYAPCIAHKIVEGMRTINEEKKATKSGYFPLFHYNPVENKFHMDSNADFDLYYEFLLGEDRYKKLKLLNDEADVLLEENKKDAMERYAYFNDLNYKD